jgi:predicted oxidoreductase
LSALPIQAHLPSASRLVMGCMGLGGGWNNDPLSSADHALAEAAVEAALAAGITLFDHADIYTFGKAEAVFGALLQARPGLRDQLLLQSKCGIRLGSAQAPGWYDLSAAHITRSVEASLQRLSTTHLDVLLLHRPDALMQPDEVAGAFDRLRQAGKVRHLGVSNMHAGQLQALQAALDAPLVVNQLEMSLAHHDWLEAGTTFNHGQGAQAELAWAWPATLARCQLHGVQLQAWGPLARGLYSGAAPADAPAAVHATARLVADMAAQHGVAPEAIVLAWLLRHPAGIQPLLGSTQPARIAAAAQAVNVQLDAEAWYRLYTTARGRALP